MNYIYIVMDFVNQSLSNGQKPMNNMPVGIKVETVGIHISTGQMNKQHD